MRPIPRFWATRSGEVDTPRGRWTMTMWGWSDHSVADAARVAGERLGLLRRLRGGPLSRDQYYPRAPLREEVLEEIHAPGGSLVGVITRNRYGAEVLNTDAVLIADIDLPEPVGLPGQGFLGGLFGRSTTPADDPSRAEAGARAVISRFAAAHPQWGVQVHRTFAGFRVMVTGTGAGPTSSLTAQILEELNTDPLYARLCIGHESHRARLTPKPWRIGLKALGDQWPRDDFLERRAAQWVPRYQQASAGYAACRREAVFGPAPGPVEALVLHRHDVLSGADSGLPLA